MSAGNIAIGSILGLVAAGLTTRIVDGATGGKEHGYQTALAAMLPLGAAYFAGGKEPGTIGRGAMYGAAVGGAAATLFVSTFTFGPPGSAPGFFGEKLKPQHYTVDNDPILLAARLL